MQAEENSELYKRLHLFSKVNRVAVTFRNANPTFQPMAAIDLDNDEVLSFLKKMEVNEVKYLLIGGFAIAFHGLVRATQDLDIWVKDEEENLMKLKNILIELGVTSLKDTRSFELIPGFSAFALGESGFVVDPMKRLKAFEPYDFDACYKRANSGTYKNVSFKVIGRADLLKEKEKTNRPKDQGDIEFLRSIQ
jgi:hypothetical protein